MAATPLCSDGLYLYAMSTECSEANDMQLIKIFVETYSIDGDVVAKIGEVFLQDGEGNKVAPYLPEFKINGGLLNHSQIASNGKVIIANIPSVRQTVAKIYSLEQGIQVGHLLPPKDDMDCLGNLCQMPSINEFALFQTNVYKGIQVTFKLDEMRLTESAQQKVLKQLPELLTNFKKLRVSKIKDYSDCQGRFDSQNIFKYIMESKGDQFDFQSIGHMNLKQLQLLQFDEDADSLAD
jgi:hypothetical protein